MHETDLYEQLAQYLNMKYPGALYHFDLMGVHNPSPVSRGLYSRLNGRAWPDLFIAEPVFMPSSINVYRGLFLELKRAGTRLQKRSGEWASQHIAEQAKLLLDLQDRGFVAQFAVGLDEAVSLIESYFLGTPIQQLEQALQDADQGDRPF